METTRNCLSALSQLCYLLKYSLAKAPALQVTGLRQYGQLFLNGHLYKTDTSLKWTPTVGPCLSLPLLIDSL